MLIPRLLGRALMLYLVPLERQLSNLSEAFLAEAEDNNKVFQNCSEFDPNAEHFTELFNVLAEWNNYLERYAPEIVSILNDDAEVQP